MSEKIKLEISSSKAERLEVARILVGNGYRVATVTCRVQSKNKTLLIVDRPEGSRNDE